MVRNRRRCWESALGLAVSALVAVLLAGPARAQQAGDPGTEAAEGGGEAEAEAYQFNLAPAKAAPGAVAEILLTARMDGGYAAEMAAMSLPEPAALKPDATTYVVWIYDPATKKKQRVASLTPEAGAGVASFDVLWPKFALVVTAEPSAEPKEWSGVAVLTGQPTVPENPGPATEAAQAQPTASASTAQATAEPSAGVASGTPDATQAAGSPTPATGPAGAEPTAVPSAQAPTAQVANASGAGTDSAAAVSANAGPAGQAGDSTAEATPTECVNAPADDKDKETSKKKKRRFSNPTLDAMAAAQHGGEQQPCPPAEK